MSEAEEILKDFLVESREGLERVEGDLVALETDPANGERLGSIFRALHTLKGNSGFFQFDKVRNLAHAGEHLLGRLRNQELNLGPVITDVLLQTIDVLRRMFRTIEETGGEGDLECRELIDQLAELAGDACPAQEFDEQATAPPIPSDPALDLIQDYSDAPRPTPPGQPPEPGPSTQVVMPKNRLAPRPPSAPPRALPAPAAPAIPARAATVQSVDRTEMGTSVPPGRPAALTVEAPSDVLSSGNIRVDVNLLDRLMNLVGELVLTRNQLLQAMNRRADPSMAGIAQRLNLVTADLQEGVLKTRMQRIGGVWQRFPRLVRDLARECGKEVVLEMQGNETELDRTLLEAIADPLVHILRNAIDHGIERPELRKARQKPSQGRLLVRAFHESGQVLIEISDDGAGIDPERIRRKLVERGLMSTAQAASLSAAALMNSVFLPGFSTADKVTHVSGRGVGMDVVRTNIERCGGTVDIESTPGTGTNFRIRLPLTLAIIPALLVTSGGRRYAIPQVNLLELLSLEPDQANRLIERVRDTEVYRLRGKLLPIVHLDRLLGNTHSPTADARSFFNIAVLRVNDQAFGLVVDDIDDSEEIVVKPLGNTLRGIPLYAGATILGDGQVALILDALGLARRAGMRSQKSDMVAESQGDSAAARSAAAQPLLLCKVGGRPIAVPLRQVVCLEEFPLTAVERLVRREVVQYRGELLPLLRLARFLQLEESEPTGDRLQVIVASDGEPPGVGIVVDEIVDVAEEPEVGHNGPRRSCVIGSAIINGEAMDLVDLQAAVRTVHSELQPS